MTTKPGVLLLFCLALFSAGVPCSAQAPDTDKGIVVKPVARTAAGGHRWALVVGINCYSNMPQLRFARQDAEALATTLVRECGFPEDNVVLMTDTVDARSPQFPTRGNLRARINQIAEVARADDVLLISFSGHGINIDGGGYLAPVDGASDDVGSFVPLSWVKTTLETCAAKQRLLVLDACHAGARAGAAADSPAEALLSPLAGAAFITLASCDARQLSHEYSELGHGVFTHSLLEGLRGRADNEAEGNRDSVVTASELFAFASLEVSRWSLRTGKAQTPVLKGEIRGRVELVRFDSRASGGNYTEPLANGVALEMVWVEGGSFTMGANDGDDDARPAHELSVRGFWISRTEVTQAQWQALMGASPSTQPGETLPVDRVSWDDACRFCKTCAEKSGKNGYGLPTEAQWEYACRGGKQERFFFDGGLSALKGYAWYKSNSRTRPHEAGSLTPNAHGLHDMLGNVWEWCEDWYEAYPGGDPNQFMSKQLRVLRGGAYFSHSSVLSSYGRSGGDPKKGERGVGFRIVRNP